MRRPRYRLLPIALLLAAVASAPPAVHALTDQDIAALQIDAPKEGAGNERPALPSTDLVRVLGRTCLALGVVFGLMGLTAWLVRRYLPQSGQSRRGGAIDILGSRSIGARRSLMLVRAHGRTLLLGVTPQSIRTLSEFEEAQAGWRESAWDAGLEDAPAAPAGTTTLERTRP